MNNTDYVFLMYNAESTIQTKCCDFAARITKMVAYLQRKRGKLYNPIYNQILRSGTSIMANVSESQYAQSRADFITKLHIALKEANETKNWLRLLFASGCLLEKEFKSINNDCGEILAILTASLNTAKKNDLADKAR